MNIKQLKLIRYFLGCLDNKLQHGNNEDISTEISDLLNRTDLIELIRWINIEDTNDSALLEMTSDELLGQIDDERIILSYAIHLLEQAITGRPTFSDEERDKFFTTYGLELHYLATKPVDEWDGYDNSNYLSLLHKHGKLVKAFVIARETEDGFELWTPEVDAYFDTIEEAEQAFEKLKKSKPDEAEGFQIKKLYRWNY